jgi:hypothetical protein
MQRYGVPTSGHFRSHSGFLVPGLTEADKITDRMKEWNKKLKTYIVKTVFMWWHSLTYRPNCGKIWSERNPQQKFKVFIESSWSQ